MAAQKITKKDMILMEYTASSIKGVLENLRVQLSILEDEIKADTKSKMDYERTLTTLETRKGDLLKRVEANKEWAKTYDTEVGPFADRYKAMTAEIGAIYERSKQGHKQGIKLLEKEFGYHVAFKRFHIHNDTQHRRYTPTHTLNCIIKYILSHTYSTKTHTTHKYRPGDTFFGIPFKPL